MIRAIARAELAELRPALTALLADAVESGASVGFVLPVDLAEIAHFWDGVGAAMARGERVLLGAFADGRLAGTVQLDLVMKSNGRHRAEVMKLLVLRSHRRRGLGRQLMLAAEAAAAGLDRTLLLLDTRRGHGAERLYRQLGYQPVGVVPGHARDPDGTFADTVFFYKQL